MFIFRERSLFLKFYNYSSNKIRYKSLFHSIFASKYDPVFFSCPVKIKLLFSNRAVSNSTHRKLIIALRRTICGQRTCSSWSLPRR